MKILTKNTLVVATTLALGLSMSSAAFAGAKAFSYLEIIDLRLFKVADDDTKTQLVTGDFVLGKLSITDTSSAFASSSFGPADFSQNLTGGNTDLACSGECGGIGPDDPTMQDPGNFSRSDTFGLGSSINGSSANVWTLAEGQQTDSGNTLANSNVSNTTEFTFTPNGDIKLRMEFDAQGMLHAELHQDATRAFASFAWSAKIVDGDGITIFEWAPDGNVTGADEIDPFTMNTSEAVNSGGPAHTYAFGASSFANQVSLTRGVEYTFSIAHGSNTDTNATKVPEPGTLFLFGASLLGLGLIKRRKQQS